VSEHRAEVSWRRETEAFDYDGFDRRHRIAFADGLALEGDAAGEYGGQARAGIDPEALFAASLGACHMLSFLAVAARMRIVVDAYADAPMAIVGKGEDGRLAVTRVVLKPRVTFAGEVASEKLAQLHDLAHRNCFVANAVKAAVVIESQDAVRPT
jgi:organic hydroperoxide reductase OsmC/OhrA